MICPNCQSKDVHIRGLQNRRHQVSCNACHHIGTYYEFGLDKVRNVGLAPFVNDAFYIVEQALFDASDPGSKMAATVHVIEGKCACNMWIMLYDQWLKYQPERIYNGAPSPFLLQGELQRFTYSAENRRQIGNDMHLEMGFFGLQMQVIALIERLAHP